MAHTTERIVYTKEQRRITCVHEAAHAVSGARAVQVAFAEKQMLGR